ncbi:MAG: peptide chain release factor 1 [Gemmataceae bacterium]
MWPSLDQNVARSQELERQMADPVVLADPGRFTKVVKEHGRLARLVKPYQEFQKLDQEIGQAEQLLSAETDAEMRRYAEEELAGLRKRREELRSHLEEMLLESSEEDFDSVIVEIRGGTGGDEAALFAGDLYNMYTHYAREQGWKVEDISFSPGEAGGFKDIVFSVTGEGAYRQLRFESGGHRVQRVPKTETQGRIHTSAATVAVMPEPDNVQVEVRDADIEWERMRAGGAGGQHVNKTESAVRIWYKRGTADELEVKCQDGRSQHKNYETAMRILKGRIYDRQQHRVHQQRAEQRRTLIGSGDRNERIRTYNFPQNRVTDHRINLTLHKLDAVIAGELGDILAALKDFDRKQRLGQAG